MKSNKTLLASSLLATLAASPTLAWTGDGPVGVSAATADNDVQPGIWQGSPSVTFIGTSAPWDSAAIKLHNQTPAAVKIKSVTVDVGDVEGINIWSAQLAKNGVIKPGYQIILTQTATGNFDLTKMQGRAIVHVKEKIGSASAVTYSFDAGQILSNPKGSTTWTKLESVSDSAK